MKIISEFIDAVKYWYELSKLYPLWSFGGIVIGIILGILITWGR